MSQEIKSYQMFGLSSLFFTILLGISTFLYRWENCENNIKDAKKYVDDPETYDYFYDAPNSGYVPDFFTLLGVGRSASRKEIKMRYRALYDLTQEDNISRKILKFAAKTLLNSVKRGCYVKYLDKQRADGVPTVPQDARFFEEKLRRDKAIYCSR